ncbi:hypothetical protein SESBI_18640 [Sesbania bispinosa]|nr:hypothetical protein SESBI_18640 [Sesbania bispinosa]
MENWCYLKQTYISHMSMNLRFKVEFKNESEAAIEGVKSIATYCIKSGTVRRLIYTASIVASSPLKEDGNDTAFKDFIDETCWTPLHLCTGLHKGYAVSKTLAERELLSYGNDENGGGIKVVRDNEATYQSLKFLEDLGGKIPVVHIEDVCEAHIFCAENPSINGRFLVANSYVSSAEIAKYYFEAYPEFKLKEKYLEGPKRTIRWTSTKLTDKGFVYKYDLKMVLDDCIKCARRLGDL